jgi:hypothetical protein
MKNLWKVYLPALVLAVVLTLTACGGGNNDTTPDPTQQPPANNNQQNQQTPTTPEEPPRDLGGIEIIIANWWTDYSTDTFEPVTFADRERLEDRIYLQNKHNFTIREVRVGDWDFMRDNHAMHLLTRQEDWHIITLAPDWFANTAGRGLFAAVPETWFTTGYGGQMNWHEGSLGFGSAAAPAGFTFGWPQGTGVPMVGGIAFNMRIFEEAGLPRDYPFILQREGRWNWENFERVARQIQLAFDVDGTGVPTIAPHAGFNQEFLARAVFSNNARFVDYCPVEDRLVDRTNTSEFFEALQWAMDLRDEGLMVHEDDVGGEWNFFIEHFNNGQAAMRSLTHGHVLAQVEPNLNDPWGFVAFPFGPNSGGRHLSYSTGGNLMAIPAVHEGMVDEIMFALMLWNRPLGGEEDDWISEQLARFHDPRSVEETMVHHTRVSELQHLSWHEMLPGTDERWRQLFAWRIWGNREEWPNASTVLEGAALEWADVLSTANRILGFGS